MDPVTITTLAKLTALLGEQVVKKVKSFLLIWFDDVKVGRGFNKLTEDQQIRFIASLKNNAPLIDEYLLGKYAHVLKEFKEMPEVDDIDRTLNTLRNIHKDELRLIGIIWINKIATFSDGLTFKKNFLNQFDINGDSWMVLQNEGLISTTSVASYSPSTNFYITAKYLKIVAILNIDNNSYLDRAILENYDETPSELTNSKKLIQSIDEIWELTQIDLKKFLKGKYFDKVNATLTKIFDIFENDLKPVESMSLEKMIDPSKYSNFVGIECISFMKKHLTKKIVEYFDRFDKENDVFQDNIIKRIEEIIKLSLDYYEDYKDFSIYKKRMKNRNKSGYLYLFDNLEKPIRFESINND